MKKRSFLSLFLICLLLIGALPVSAKGKATPSPTPEPSPAPTPIIGERVNFLVAGIDHRDNGSTTSGTMVHSDTVMVVSVDFENKLVDVISLARDMFVRVPGHKGYYKLNAAFNVGGGMDDPDSGFLAVAATASEILGGISIPYYIAVNLSSLEGLIDAIGGVDIEIEQPFSGGKGKRFEAGMQHLDGGSAVRYARLRKSATVERNDAGRTNRQRKLIMALYKQVKKTGIITSLPSIISSFKGSIWTNISLTQMATLATFALDFEPDDVGMHSLPGKLTIHEGWAYHFLDESARKELLYWVYGMQDAAPYGISSKNYADYLHGSGFRNRKTIAQSEKVFAKLSAQVESGVPMTAEQEQLYTDAYTAYTAAVQAADEMDAFMRLYPDGIPRGEARETQKKLNETIGTTQKSCKKTAVALGKTLGMKDDDFQWAVWPVFYKDLDINEIFVDFN